ncbi:hypothetical protein AWB70_01040 [Caballeronia cordobensis]|uniref:Uncharacterized protein n=1 Tax=Caballeronia cordobensis TaxID=1353886 RepID=A0A158FKN6_CABCO|nr:hypothetical protein [Caballeronia cordobensis]SAL20428.1 hypothetical protein AWB70_01040 [Caballeronia cordobensis]
MKDSYFFGLAACIFIAPTVPAKFALGIGTAQLVLGLIAAARGK